MPAPAAAAHSRRSWRGRPGHDVRFLRYWVNEQQGKVFCLVEAPSADDASAVHRQAHGLVADEIYIVQEGT
jgi:hypothetical protein